MKQRSVIVAVLFATLLCAPLSIPTTGTPNSRPDCVKCGFNGSCRSCVGGTRALYCETFNCGACQETGYCSGSGPDEVLQARLQGPEREQDIEIPPSVIRDIGAKHPRFAITLAEMALYGISPSDRRVYWTPVTLSSSDVEPFLNKAAHRRFFKQYDREVRRLNSLIQKGAISDIVYAISIKETENSWSIKMQIEGDLAVASVDPSYSTLEIQIESPQVATQATSGQQLSRHKVTWQIQ